jgi:capsular exopolysaccharide synthesis family protein
MKDSTTKNSGLPPGGGEFPLMIPVDAEGGAPSPIKIERFSIFLKRYWWVPLLTLVVAVGVAVAFIALRSPTYVSSARLWETEKLSVPGGPEFTGDTANYYGTQIELLRSQKLQQLALTRLQNSRTNPVPLGEDNRPLQVHLRIAQAPKSTVFNIEAASSNPEFAQSFLNALMTEYVEYKRNIRKTVSSDTLASISDQALRLEKDLKADQDALTVFERTNNMLILQEEGNIAGVYLARLETQLSDIKLESDLLEASVVDQEWTDTTKTNGLFLAESLRGPYSGPVFPSLDRQSSLREVELLKTERDKLSRHLRPKHPKIVKLNADIARAQQLVELFRSQNHQQLEAARQTLKMKLEGVESTIKDWEPKVQEANARIAEADHLKLNVNRSQALYDRLVALLQNVDLSRAIDQENEAILDTASPALRSYKVEAILLGLAIFVGLAIGLGTVLLIDLRDDRFTSTSEVSEKFDGAIVGQVPEVPVVIPNSPLPLLEHEDQRHMFAESYRNLRSALVYMPVEGEPPRVVLITSAVPDEGKSTVAANLARSLAFGGSNVLLVDGDLRRGTLHDLVGLASEPGLAEIIRASRDPQEVIQRTELPNLAFVSRGSTPVHPADIFLSPELDRVLSRWRKSFDYVLIDSSPVFAADDATTLAPKVDGTLFVVRSRYSRAGAVREALDLLGQRQAKVLGLVYNRADSSARKYHYYKHESYAYAAIHGH